MLWLKAWFETRWRIVWALLMGVLLFGFLRLSMARVGGVGDPQKLAGAVLGLSTFVSFLATIMLAGSGIQTASARPGASAKGAAESTLFTLALPVTRARLFAVRTVTGLLETTALVTMFAVAVWLLWPPFRVNAHDVLGQFAVIASCSATVYAISACLSTFLDEGWRIRFSSIAMAVLFALATSDVLPRSVNIFRPIVGASPLFTHHVPWATIVAAVALSALFLGAALTIIQKRDY